VKELKGGTTNQLYIVTMEPSKTVLVRIYGFRTGDLIDRDAENYYLIKIFKSNPDKVPDVYCKFGNGLIYEYIEGRALVSDELPIYYEQIAKELAGWHQVQVEPFHADYGKKPQLFKTIYSWIKQARGVEMIQLPLSLDQIENETKQLEKIFSEQSYPVCFSHNDLTYGNLIFNQNQNTIRFIDYEYCGYNYRGFDIGNHWCEYTGLNPMDLGKYPTRDHRLKFIRAYLGENATQEQVENLYVEASLFVLMSNIMWSVWGIVQGRHSTLGLKWGDTEESWYQGYTRTRLNWYLSLKDETLQLLNKKE
jgi:ethanolamine kinase